MAKKLYIQKNLILGYLQKGKKITALSALHYFGCLRLGARIYELRKMGYKIKDRMKKTNSGKWVKEYWIDG